MKMSHKTLSILLRLAAGALALVCFVLVFLRIYGLFVVDTEATHAESFVHLLRILFPLSLGLISGYITFTGKIPFT